MKSTKTPVRLIRYAKYGIGKSIGGKIYVHKSYEHVFYDDPETNSYYTNAQKHVSGFNNKYIVVAYNQKTKVFTFSWCADFDTNPEPTIGEQHVVYPDGTVKILKMNSENPYIYHHKWMMVGPDYKGFDVAASTRRSFLWTSLPDIDYSRIGRLQFWNKNVIPKLKKILFQKGNLSIEVRKASEPVSGGSFKYTLVAYIEGYSLPIQMGLGNTIESAMDNLSDSIREESRYHLKHVCRLEQASSFVDRLIR